MSDATPAARTNSRWLADLPAEWDGVRLRHLGRLKTGTTPSRSHDEYYTENGGMPWAKPEDLGAVKPITDSTEHLTPEGQEKVTSVPEGSVLVCCIGSVGELGFAGTQLATNQQITSVTFQEDLVVPRFGFYALSAAREELRSRINTSVLAILSTTDMGGIRLPAPPLGIQQAIADFLDSKTAGIDQIVKDKKRLIERLVEKRQALIDFAVSGGLPHGAEQKKPTASWLPALPPEWAKTRIKHIAKPEVGSFTDGDWVESPYITDSGVRLIQTGNIGVGQYREQGFRYISESSFDELSCTEVRPGDILICRLADPVGRACQAPDLGGRMITAVDVAILKPRPEHDPRFLVYFFSSTPYLKWVEKISRGGTRDRISRSMLSNIQVPTPPPEEEVRIADYLDEECGAIDAMVEDLDKQIALLHEYRSSLITAAVTGQIDVRASTPAVA